MILLLVSSASPYKAKSLFSSHFARRALSSTSYSPSPPRTTPRRVLQRPVILLRHAPSVYNSPAKVFTGWVDCPLVWPTSYFACGEAGVLLYNFLRHLPSSTSSSPLVSDHSSSVPISGLAAVYTSVLTRATDTCSLVLSVVSSLQRRPPSLNHLPPGVVSIPALNERHYGALSGLLKDPAVWEDALAGRSPAAQRVVRRAIYSWRREYDARPPPWTSQHPARAGVDGDVRYKNADGSRFSVPLSESLSDTSQRLESAWSTDLLPVLTSPIHSSTSSCPTSSSGAVLIVAHANTIRCIVKDLDGLSLPAVESLQIPAGLPFFYPAGTVVGGGEVAGKFTGTFLEDKSLGDGEKIVVESTVADFMRGKRKHGKEWERDEIFRSAKVRTEEYARSEEWYESVPSHLR
jgi:2,3-bisphosphoglycerate-dependent phosphoglycerate mutase